MEVEDEEIGVVAVATVAAETLNDVARDIQDHLQDVEIRVIDRSVARLLQEILTLMFRGGVKVVEARGETSLVAALLQSPIQSHAHALDLDPLRHLLAAAAHYQGLFPHPRVEDAPSADLFHPVESVEAIAAAALETEHEALIIAPVIDRTVPQIRVPGLLHRSLESADDLPQLVQLRPNAELVATHRRHPVPDLDLHLVMEREPQECVEVEILASNIPLKWTSLRAQKLVRFIVTNDG